MRLLHRVVYILIILAGIALSMCYSWSSWSIELGLMKGYDSHTNGMAQVIFYAQDIGSIILPAALVSLPTVALLVFPIRTWAKWRKQCILIAAMLPALRVAYMFAASYLKFDTVPTPHDLTVTFLVLFPVLLSIIGILLVAKSGSPQQ